MFIVPMSTLTNTTTWNSERHLCLKSSSKAIFHVRLITRDQECFDVNILLLQHFIVFQNFIIAPHYRIWSQCPSWLRLSLQRIEFFLVTWQPSIFNDGGDKDNCIWESPFTSMWSPHPKYSTERRKVFGQKRWMIVNKASNYI